MATRENEGTSAELLDELKKADSNLQRVDYKSCTAIAASVVTRLASCR